MATLLSQSETGKSLSDLRADRSPLEIVAVLESWLGGSCNYATSAALPSPAHSAGNSHRDQPRAEGPTVQKKGQQRPVLDRFWAFAADASAAFFRSHSLVNRGVNGFPFPNRHPTE